MSFTLLDHVGEHTALHLLRLTRPPGKPHRIGSQPLPVWRCPTCGGEAHARKVPDGAMLWCEACEDFTGGQG